MKYRAYMGLIPHLSADEYHQQMTSISASCKEVNAFELDGCIFAGDITTTIKAYLKESPDKSFFVWLIDNGLELKQTQT